MDSLNKIIDKMMKAFLSISAAIVFVITFAQVCSRFLFKMPLSWSTDIIRLAFVYSIFIGAAYCVKHDEHLRVDVLLTMLKPKDRAKMEILINFVLLVFAAFLLYFGLGFSITGTVQRAPSINIPMTVYYFSIPLSAGFMIFYLAQQIIDKIKEINGISNRRES